MSVADSLQGKKRIAERYCLLHGMACAHGCLPAMLKRAHFEKQPSVDKVASIDDSHYFVHGRLYYELGALLVDKLE